MSEENQQPGDVPAEPGKPAANEPGPAASTPVSDDASAETPAVSEAADAGKEPVEPQSDASSAAAPAAGGDKKTAPTAKKNKKRRPPRSAAEKLQKGVVEAVEGDQVRVAFGPKVHGTIGVSEFDTAPEVGQEYEFTFESIKDDVWLLSRRDARLRELWDGLKVGDKVNAKVIGENSGGLELRVGPVAAFMPSRHVSLQPVKDNSQFFGQELECEVLELNRRRNRMVVSRRAMLMREQDVLRKQALATVKQGDRRKGVVERLEAFGAIVNLGDGLSGLVHVSNLSHQRVNHPKDMLSIGQEVEVQILELKQGGKRIGLGIKQLAEDPWVAAASRLRPHSRVSGKITRIADFGAFVDLGEGVEGLLHISQLLPERVESVGDVVKAGEEVQVRILQVEPERRRISLSRLSAKGALIGSEDDTDDDDAPEAGDASLSEPPAQRGTNLGDVLRRALEGK